MRGRLPKMHEQDSPAPSDLASHIKLVRGLAERPHATLGVLFQRGSPVYVARAPGRLDVMGGIADYSGSLVLQLPIAEAAFVSMQAVGDVGVTVISMEDPSSAGLRKFSMAAPQWGELRHSSYDTAREVLAAEADAAWAAYVLGPVLVLLREAATSLPGGLRILVDSRVPEGKGVSSSAALEVAAMRACAALLGTDLSGDELARLCQVAENHIVGAPCGIMDQMTAALGRENELLALRCQPATVECYVPIPRGVAFWGIDSGIRHAVSGADYTSVRCGAFMGYRIIAHAAGLTARPAHDAPGAVEIDDPFWHGYLANLTPAEFRSRFAAAVPEEMRGEDFLQRFGGTTDRVTRVNPTRTYAVLRPTRHPIEENERVCRFRALLGGDIDSSSLREMGELMAASHASYSACGLASEGTDLLVKLVHETQAASGLFGAKITGGGSGGTVAVLGRPGADTAVARIARRYEELTGRAAHIFRGSSPGACATPVCRVTA